MSRYKIRFYRSNKIKEYEKTKGSKGIQYFNLLAKIVLEKRLNRALQKIAVKNNT